MASDLKGVLVRAGELTDLMGHVIEFFHPRPDPAKVAGDFGEH